MCLVAQDLTIRTRDGARLLGPLDLRIESGERVGLVGESGSGKSLLGRAMMGFAPRGLELFVSRSLMGREPGHDWRHLAWVPQEASMALHPLLSVGEHLTLLAGMCLEEPTSRGKSRLTAMLERLGLPVDGAFLGRFPGQLSGGQRQRLALVMALGAGPRFLILDEPTSALDETSCRAVAELIGELQRERGMGCLWIGHDLGIMASVTDRLLVLYGGTLLEAGPTRRLLASPRSPYLARLIAAARGEPSEDSGFLPAPERWPQGCPFRPRCPDQGQACGEEVTWEGLPEDGVRCPRQKSASVRQPFAALGHPDASGGRPGA